MITDDLELLYQLKTELKGKRKAYRESVKGLKHSIEDLEQKVTEQILKTGKTVTVGGIKAEYVPTVVFRMKKENSNE